MNPRVKPIGDQVLVRLVSVEQKTKGGIVLPSETQAREQGGTMSGTVMAIGDDAWGRVTQDAFKVGDRVCFGRYAGGSIGLMLDGVPDDVARLWRLIGASEIQAVESDDGVEIA